MTMEITMYSGGVSTTSSTPPPGSRTWEPRLFKGFTEASEPFLAVVHDWLEGKDLVLLRAGQFHDGTLIFELEAIMNISQVAIEYMQDQGGKWEASKVCVINTDKVPPKPWMRHEEYYMLLRRLEAQ